MQVTAKLNYLRIAPRKVRLVADLIRKKEVKKAQMILNFTIKKASKPLLKLLNSATANARNNFQLDSNNLYISKITVDEGPKYKRWMPRARGLASEIQKKTSHITIVLDEIKLGEILKEKPRKKPRKAEKEKVAVSEKKEIKEETKPGFKKQGLKPKEEMRKQKPKRIQGIRRIFQRKAF